MSLQGVTISEVGPRDGLQNEDVVLSVASRAELIQRLMATGIRRVEVTSFVNPKKVPAMADGEAVIASLRPPPGVELVGLALNVKGAERAVAAGIGRINFALVATETFNHRNQGCTVEESIRHFERVSSISRDAKTPCTVTIGAAFGCPFEGRVDPATVEAIAVELGRLGADEVVLADTIGVAVPQQIRVVVDKIVSGGVSARLGLHLHNTRNTGLANAQAGLDLGLDLLDASVGGAGGCPFAPKATGNIPTEDLLYMLHTSGYRTGINLEGVADTARWLERQLSRKLPGMVKEAGAFPDAWDD